MKTKPGSSSKKTYEGTPTSRTLQVLIKVMATPRPVAIDDLEAEFGDRRRLLDAVVAMNREWEVRRGKPLVRFLDRNLQPNEKRRAFVQRVDDEASQPIFQNVVVLSAVTRFLRPLDGTPFQEGAGALVDSMRTGLAGDNKQLLARLAKKYHVVLKGEREYGPYADQLDEIQKALLYEKRLAVSWRPPGREEAVRFVVEPYALVMYGGGIYLAARSVSPRDEAAPRCYAIESIEEAAATKERFDYPVEFDVKRWYEGTFGIMAGGSKDAYKVTLEVLDKAVLPYLLRRTWGAAQSFDDKTMLLTFETKGLEELSRWVLGFGPSVRVVTPAALKDRVRDALREASKNYA